MAQSTPRKDERNRHHELLDLIEHKLDQLEAQLDELEAEDFDTEGEMSEIQSLVWALIDEEITDEQMRRLEELVLADEEARQTYIRCVQMHVDLIYFFRDQRARESGQSTPTPFIGLLPDTLRSIGIDTPSNTNG